MNKIFIIISSLFIIILGAIFLYFTHTNWQSLHCNTHFIMNFISNEGKKLELNLDINVVTTNEGSGEFVAVGSLSGSGHNYVVSRRIFITIERSNFKGVTKSTIIHEVRHPIDNIPDDLWRKYILPEVPGIAFYMEMRKLGNDLYFIKGLTSPHFVCAVAKI